MKRTILAFLNRLGWYTRNQTRTVLGQSLDEICRLWHRLPAESKASFAEQMLHASRSTAALLSRPGQGEILRLFQRTMTELAVVQRRPDSLRQLHAQWINSSLPLDQQLRLRDDLARVVAMDYDAHRIWLHVDSALEADLRTLSCAKEPGTVAWIEDQLRPGDVLYDVGANVGAYSLVAAKHVEGRARVFAFEPSYLNFFQLCRNVLLNGCEQTITPMYLPLCRQTGPGLFHYHNLDRGGSLHCFGQTVDYKGDEFAPVASLGTVGFNLDDWVKAARLPPPHLIKLDVDGLEKNILLGATEILRMETLRGVLVELNENLAEECSSILEVFHQAGLTPREKHPLMKAHMYNYLFHRPRRLPSCPPRTADVVSTIERSA